MPTTKQGATIVRAMKQTYKSAGSSKRIFYASAKKKKGDGTMKSRAMVYKSKPSMQDQKAAHRRAGTLVHNGAKIVKNPPRKNNPRVMRSKAY